MTVGAAEANNIIIQTLMQDGDELATQTPTYKQVWGLAQNRGSVVRPFHMQPDKGWQLDTDDLDAQVNEINALFYNYTGILQRDARPAGTSGDQLGNEIPEGGPVDEGGIKEMAASVVASSRRVDELASALPEVELDEAAQLKRIAALQEENDRLERELKEEEERLEAERIAEEQRVERERKEEEERLEAERIAEEQRVERERKEEEERLEAERIAEEQRVESELKEEEER